MKKLPGIVSSRRPAIKRIGMVIAEIPVIAAFLYAGCQIATKAILYLAGLRGPDATLYFTMGNAIRHGFTVYQDLFDPKPPGIFLLSAASFSLFSDGTLAYMLNVIILLAIPVMFVWWGMGLRKIIIVQWALIIGLTFALYHATIGGDVQTEFYGAFFGLMYVAAVEFYMRGDGRIARTGAVIIASMAFSIALLFKEPFLITLFAAALLLLRTFREWLRLFLIPLITAGMTYIVVLASLSALGNYFTIYLHAMLGNYILNGGPVWARGLVAWERIYINVHDFTPWFPVLLAVMFVLSLPEFSGTTRHVRSRWIGIAFAAACVTGIVFVRSFFPGQFLWNVHPQVALVPFAAALGGLLSAIRHGGLTDFVRRTWRHGLALYLTMTAIGLGSGFHGQYFALALPVYAALFLLVLQKYGACHPERCEGDMRRANALVLSITVIASCILLTSTPFTRSASLSSAVAGIRSADHQDRVSAAALDAMLDACDIDRYYFLEASPLPYATHAPLDFYLFTRIEHITRYHPLFYDETFRRLGEAQIILETKPYMPSPKKGNQEEECIGNGVRTFVEKKFTAAPRACAKGLPVPAGYQVLFRKDAGGLMEPEVQNCKNL